MVSFQRSNVSLRIATPFKVTKSLLSKGLLVRRPFANALLRFLNRWTRSSNTSAPLPKRPKKILLCNIASFGDVVISTTVLPLLHQQYPDAEIGFVTASATSVIVQSHPLVTHSHTLDHWYLQRSEITRFFKPKHAFVFIAKAWKFLLNYKKQTNLTLKEIKKINYDLAIDLHIFFPNAIPFLKKTNIPFRMGYPTGGFSKLLTHVFPWCFEDRYIGYSHLNLVAQLGISTQHASPLPCYMRKTKTQSYITLHAGSLNPLKEWSQEHWARLAQLLIEAGHEVRLTGQGAREAAQCAYIAQATGAINLSNRLSWDEFVIAVQESKLLISIDSAAVHLAAGSLTPTLILCTGITTPHLWTPPFSLCRALLADIACAPCLKNRGCSSMACIQELSPKEVYSQALDLLAKSERPKLAIV